MTRFFVIVGVETFSTTRQLRWTKLLPFVTNRKPFKGSFYVFVTFDHLAKSTKKENVCWWRSNILLGALPERGPPFVQDDGGKSKRTCVDDQPLDRQFPNPALRLPPPALTLCFGIPDRHPLTPFVLPTTAFSKAPKTTALAQTMCLEWRHQNRNAPTRRRAHWDRLEQSWRPRRRSAPVPDPLWYRSRAMVPMVLPPGRKAMSWKEGRLRRECRSPLNKPHTSPCRPTSMSAGDGGNTAPTVRRSRLRNVSPAP